MKLMSVKTRDKSMMLNQKITLYLSLMSLVPLAAAITLTVVFSERAISEQVIDRLEHVAQLHTQAVENALEQNTERLGLIASRTQLRLSLRDFTRTGDVVHRQMMNRILLDAKNAINAIDRIAIVDMNGVVVAATDASMIETAMGDRRAFELGLRGLAVDQLSRNAQGHLEVKLVAPLALDDEVLGVLVITVDAESIMALNRNFAELGRTGETYLVKADGDHATVISPLRFRSDAALVMKVPLSQRDHLAVRAVTSETPKVFDYALDYRERPVLAATRPIDNADWALVAKIDKTEAFQSIYRLRDILMLIVGIGSAGIVLVAVKLAETIARPVRALTAAAHEIRRGNYHQNVPVTTGDEIGVLTRVFNDMSQSLLLASHELTQINNELREEVEERRQAERALRESEERYRSFLQNFQGIAYQRSIGDDTAIFMHGAVVPITGYPAEDFLGRGRRWVDLVVPEDRMLIAREWRALAERADYVSDCQYRITTSSGEIRWVRDIARSVGSRIDDERVIQGVVYDVSERVAVESELKEYRQHLEDLVSERTQQYEQANKELEAFAYSVSHDLRAPLRSISGFSQILIEDCRDLLDDVHLQHLRRVRDGAQRMSDLIDAMLKLSRLSRQEMDFEQVNLSRICEEVIRELRQATPDRQVDVEIAPDVVTEADPKLMRLVMENLLRNAWKFTARTASPAIEFGVIDEHNRRVYFVKDNGAGFDEAYADRLFGAFQRLHRQEEFPGTGVGLAIVQRVVHRHNGRVWATAAPDEGATFYFYLDSRKRRLRWRESIVSEV